MHRALSAAIFATLLVAAPVLAGPARAGDAVPGTSPLKTMLMDKVDAMNVRSAGIFREEVTPDVAPYFPLGQSMADTERVMAEQKLGKMKPFKGTNDLGMGTMFVAKSDLVSHVFAHVYVVFDFDYAGTAPDMKLIAMKAYMRSGTM